MKLCIALDLPSKQENLALIKSLAHLDSTLWLKVGLRSFLRDGREFLLDIKEIGDFKLFLDLKLYDIPNTMCDAFSEIAHLGVNMLTIHASSGLEAMQALAKQKSKDKNSPLILAVSALTSFDDKGFMSVYNAKVDSHALHLARLAYEGGVDGVVCSCFEVENIKAQTHKNFITLTPAIRPFGENSGDQKRVADIAMAKKVGSDFIVIGRPIYQSSDPKAVVERILESMN